MSIFALVILVAAVIGVIAYLSWLAEKKRREALLALATKLGLSYSPEKNHGLATQYKFIDQTRQGSNRYASNVVQGTYRDYPVILFDYHYETHSTDSKGRRQTHHHHLAFFILTMKKAFAEIKISKEGFFSKIAQTFGYDDIDFESHEFSRKFCVRSPDKKFAYDVCHARMIEYMLANEDLTIEIENHSYALSFGAKMRLETIQHNLDRLVELRGLMPDYLFTE
jgi:hypothetical protein